ncbi:hypothetical protein [Bdellovibrio bacteriovorus]|uniref:hypothetical protein n=1 Tax=Bdellovibrio bacteriovorus TaxID=959 RepID=UPI003AA861AE
MRIKILFLIPLFYSVSTFAAPAILDPQNLLKEVDSFLSQNIAPQCGETTAYDYARCKTVCNENTCQIDTCSLYKNDDGVVLRQNTFNTIQCNDKEFGLLIKPAYPYMGHQTWFSRSELYRAESAIQAGFQAFLPWSVGGSCSGESHLNFWLSQLVIQNVSVEVVKLKSGVSIPARRISGRMTLPVNDVMPGCRKMSVESNFDIWMGQGVLQSEQFLRFDFANQTFFSIVRIHQN